jgi:hypothetical protein
MKTETVPAMLAAAIKTKKSKVTPTEPTPAEYREPTPAQRIVERAHSAKVNAVDNWINGRITSKEHTEIHKKANAVIACKGKVKP